MSGGEPPLLVLGCGFVGSEAARQAIARGRVVLGTTRRAEHADTLRAMGVEVRVAERLTRRDVEALDPGQAEVLVAFAPDGTTDAEIAEALAPALSIAYVSTTGVYGGARGRVDEDT